MAEKLTPNERDLLKLMYQAYRDAGDYLRAELDCKLAGLNPENVPESVSRWYWTIEEETGLRLEVRTLDNDLPEAKPIRTPTVEEAERQLHEALEKLLETESEIQNKHAEIEKDLEFEYFDEAERIDDRENRESFLDYGREDIQDDLNDLYHEIADTIIEERLEQLFSEYTWIKRHP